MPRPTGIAPYGRKELMAEFCKKLPPGLEWILVEHSLYVRPLGHKQFIRDIRGKDRPFDIFLGTGVKVTPTGDGHASHWYGLLLEVFSNRERMDGVVLHFDSVLNRAKDERSDYQGGLHIWSGPGLIPNDGEDWYIARPESLEPLVKVVNQYINFWCKEA